MYGISFHIFDFKIIAVNLDQASWNGNTSAGSGREKRVSAPPPPQLNGEALIVNR